MNEEQQTRIILGAITLVLIKAAIDTYNHFRGHNSKAEIKVAREPSAGFYFFGLRLGHVCRNLFKKHVSNK